MSTVARYGPGFRDGVGEDALFDGPSGIVVLEDNSLLVADTHNNRIRKITVDGNLYTSLT